MTGWKRLAGVAVAVLLAASGCATCGHWACHPALEAGPDCPTPAAHRNKVYVVFVNGLIPGCCGSNGLRDKLAACGFEKVYTGELCHTGWLAREMQKVHREDPTARFVVVGYDLGGSAAVRLAAEAVAGQIPVEAVVLLDPTGKQDPAGSGVRTIVVRSGAGLGTVPHAECVSVPEAGHFSLPTHPQTVAVLCHLLDEVATNVWLPPCVDPVPVYDHAPPERAVGAPGPAADPNWLFLLDRSSGHVPPLAPGPEEKEVRSNPARAGSEK